MDILESYFNKFKFIPGNINEHFDVLKLYSSKCDTVIEMGIGTIVSTWALLAGKPKKLVSYDINHPSIHGSNINEVFEVCKTCNISYEFIQADTAEVDIENSDLLFIDTLHDYHHLKKELFRHSSKINKYIIMHDTVTFGIDGQTAGCKGLIPAIEEFLSQNKDWKIKEHFTHNNGLTVLEKI
jgi:hypothetical protein